MPLGKIRRFLDENGVKYTTTIHSMAYTAQEIAAAAHIPGKELAKTVMVLIDRKMAMAVLPASLMVNTEHLREALGAREVLLAGEKDFRDMFPECEVGAMPPFGNLYGMDVYADHSLARDREIAFNAGSHIELMRLSFEDFKRLVKPRFVEFAMRPDVVLR
jgi:Ala-tRNA(Pro) deacylase